MSFIVATYQQILPWFFGVWFGTGIVMALVSAAIQLRLKACYPERWDGLGRWKSSYGVPESGVTHSLRMYRYFLFEEHGADFFMSSLQGACKLLTLLFFVVFPALFVLLLILLA